MNWVCAGRYHRGAAGQPSRWRLHRPARRDCPTTASRDALPSAGAAL